MKNKAYRKMILGVMSYLLIALVFFITACEEDEIQDYLNPTINFELSSEYISSDTTLLVGQSFKIGIHAESNGHNKLTNFIARINGERYMDLGIFKDVYDRELEITKSLEDIENWEFIIRDIDGNSSSVYVTIFKDPNISYGKIDEYFNVELGAQYNDDIGSFFSLDDGIVYNLVEAYNNQELIDLLYYYDDFDKLEENIIASPGANLTGVYSGQYDIANWDITNTTRFSREKLDILVDEFDNASNDSILIANSFAFESGGRKTKFLKAGDVYSFVTGRKIRMFKVLNTSGTKEGSIVVDIKFQK